MVLFNNMIKKIKVNETIFFLNDNYNKKRRESKLK